MIGTHDFSKKVWLRGKGRGAVWDDVGFGEKRLGPQYLVEKDDYDKWKKGIKGHKLAFMSISSATNQRTFISSVIQNLPTNHALGLLQTEDKDFRKLLVLSAVMNTFAFDYAVRARLGGLNLSYFVIDELPLPHLASVTKKTIEELALRAAQLTFIHNSFAEEWLMLRFAYRGHRAFINQAYRQLWAVTAHERLRLMLIIEAVVGGLYGLEIEEFLWVLRDCDRPVAAITSNEPTTLYPKGFWRVDKDKDPELRHTVLTLAAFRELKTTIVQHSGDCDQGIEAFCSMNDGDGWQLPETLCLAELGLGHDDRAKTPQPVRSRLGGRFLPWQLEQSVEESWAECEMHARNILGEEGFARLKAEIKGETTSKQTDPLSVAEPNATYNKKEQDQGNLFNR